MTKNQKYLENRILEEGQYIANNLSTVRETAKVFGMSKSTIHSDITEKLPELNKDLAEDVRLVLDLNLEERSSRAGKSRAINMRLNLN
jgi:putative DeoR family transcriptional regulator (stage III sporulation protein D)